MSTVARETARRLAGEGASLQEIYAAIGRSGQAVDKWVAECRKRRPRRQASAGPSPQVAARASQSERATLSHRYRLRADLVVTLELPVNLSCDEAARLAAVVRSLPFQATRSR